MKVLLSCCFVALIYVGIDFGMTKQVDYTGEYYDLFTSTKIVSCQLSLKEDGSFKCHTILSDATMTTYITKGEYKVRGNQLQFFPVCFKTHPDQNRATQTGSKIKIQCHDILNISEKKSSSLFKKSLASFEAGTTRLKPKYYIKRTKNQLSLCVLDLKTEQFIPQFFQSKK